MKIGIVVHSESNTTVTASKSIEKGISNEGVESCLLDIKNLDLELASTCDGFIFGSPVYNGDTSHQMKEFLEKEVGKMKLNHKLCGVFATANFAGGGGEHAMSTMLVHLMVQGAMVYSGGCANGKPYTHQGALLINEFDFEKQEDKLISLGQKLAAQLKLIK